MVIVMVVHLQPKRAIWRYEDDKNVRSEWWMGSMVTLAWRVRHPSRTCNPRPHVRATVSRRATCATDKRQTTSDNLSCLKLPRSPMEIAFHC